MDKIDKIYLLLIIVSITLSFFCHRAWADEPTKDIELVVFTANDYTISVTVFNVDGQVIKYYEKEFDEMNYYPIITVMDGGAYYIIEVCTNKQCGIELEYYIPEIDQGFVVFGEEGLVRFCIVNYKIARRDK